MKIRLGVLLVLIFACAFLQAQPPIHKPLVWSVKAGNPMVFEKPRDWSGHLSAVTFSPDGTILATGGGSWGRENTPQGGSIWLWNAQIGASQGELSGHKDIVQAIAFSPDGRLLASQSQDGALFLWDTKTSNLRHRLAAGYAGNKKPDLAQSLAQPRLVLGAWSPDSKTLATYEWKFDVGSEPPNYAHSIKLFDANTGQLIRSFTPRPSMLSKMAWTGDGKNLIISTQTIKDGNPEESAVETIDGQSGAVLRRLAVNRGVYQSVAAFSSDSRYALVSFRNETNGEAPATQTVHLWDLQDDRAVWTKTVPKDAMWPAAFTRDGKTLVADNGDGGIAFYDALTGMAQRELPSSSCNDLGSLALAPDARRIAFVEEAMGIIYLWNLEAPIPSPRFASQTVLRELHNVRALQWRGDEMHVITEVSDWGKDLRTGQELRIDTWNAATGQVKRRVIAEKRLMSDAALSPDGALLAVELGTQPQPALFKSEGIGLYDLQAGKLLRLLPEKYGLSGLAWSPDSKTLATSVHEGDITLWNAQSGEKQRVLRTEAISIAWSPDGKTLAAGGADGIVQFFNSQTGREEDEWQTKGAVQRLAWSPDGKKLALGVTMQERNQAGTSTVRVWDVEMGREMRALGVARVLQHLHWTPDSSAIAVSGRADINRADKGQLRVWDAANGAELIALDERCGLEDFAFSPDGTRLAAHAWNRLRVWQLK
ncbi:MAG TPA: WD40 repeat domain-containing protein [Abditibacteriaceae bacterium]